MSFWNKLYSFRTRTYLEIVPKLNETVMCQLIKKDSHGFVFKLIDYPGLEARLTFKNAHAKRRKKIMNKLFPSHEKLYPLVITSIEYFQSSHQPKLETFTEETGSDHRSDEEESEEESESNEEEDHESTVEEEPSSTLEHIDEEEKPYIMLSNLGLTPEFKKDAEKEYYRFLQILGIVHKFAMNSFKKLKSKERPDQMTEAQLDTLFSEYKVYAEDIVRKTVWALPRDKVFSYFNEFKNKFKADTEFDLEPKAKKELATLIRKQLRNPDYTINYYFQLTTIRFSIDDSQSGYHFLINLFQKALDMNREQINKIDPTLTIKMKNVTDLNEKGKQISKKTQDALSYAVQGKSKDEKALRSLVDDIIASIQKLKGPFENFKKLEVSIHNSETHQIDITKFDQ